MVPEAKNNQFKQLYRSFLPPCVIFWRWNKNGNSHQNTCLVLTTYGYCLRRKVSRDVSAPNQFRCTYSLVPEVSAFVLTAYAYCLRKNPAKDNRTFRIQIISVFRRFYIYRNHWQNQTLITGERLNHSPGVFSLVSFPALKVLSILLLSLLLWWLMSAQF